MPYSATRISELLDAEGADAALGYCVEALAQAPADATLHHVHGRILNNLDRLPEALEALDQAVISEPDNATMLAHRGHVLLRLQRMDEATDDFRQSIALDTSQMVALGGLASICLATGHMGEAAALLSRLTDCDSANHVHWLNLGLARQEIGLLREAEEAFRAALNLAPGNLDIWCALGSVLQSQGNLDEACEWFSQVLRSQSDHPQAIAAIAGIRELEGRSDESMEMLRPLLSNNAVPVIRLAAAQLLQKSGDTREAVEHLTAVLTHAEADPLQRSTAHFLLSAMWDKSGEYDLAFAEAAKGNQIRSGRYSAENQEQWFVRNRKIFDGGVLERLAGAAALESPVIFIVGMPRSGTSLVEQILASHSKIYGAGELDSIVRLATGLGDVIDSRRVYPECLEEAKADQIEALSADLGARYRTLAGTAGLVTDKMWQNFEYLGLIQLLLPASKVIHCCRDPRDTSLSCFLQGFGVAGPPFSYSLPGIAHYYRQYQEMMNYWQRTLKLQILDVQYEEVVTSPEVQIKRILEFLGLQWESDCLKFHRTRRVVRTASSDQVRQPIYRSSVGRHSNYSGHLAEFFAALPVYDDG